MKKRLGVLLVLVFFMVMSLGVSASATNTAGYDNFVRERTYQDDIFSDISASAWYADYVKVAYELGLMNGVGAGFNPGGNITIAETLALASRINSIYNTGKAEFIHGNTWYQTYADYALANGIIKEGEYSSYTKPASRVDFANIIYAALPTNAWTKINNISSLPDVSSSDWYSPSVFTLYNAGILMGNDEYGSFNPNSTITRSEVAAIIIRVAVPSERKTFTLTQTEAQTAEMYYNSGLLSFQSHSGVPCSKSIVNGASTKSYVPSEDATYIYNGATYRQFISYIAYLTTEGLPYESKRETDSVVEYEYQFRTTSNNMFWGVTLTYYKNSNDVFIMHIGVGEEYEGDRPNGTENAVYYNNGVLSYQSYIGAACLKSQVNSQILDGYVAANIAAYSYPCMNIADFNKYVDYVNSTEWFVTEKESTIKYGGQYESIIYANSKGWLLNCVYSGAYNQVLIYVVQ